MQSRFLGAFWSFSLLPKISALGLNSHELTKCEWAVLGKILSTLKQAGDIPYLKKSKQTKK